MKSKKRLYRACLTAVLLLSFLLALLLDKIELSARAAPMYLYTLTLVSMFTFLLFLVICFIKQIVSFVPNLLVAVGLCGYLLCASLHAFGILDSELTYSLCGCLIGIGVMGAALTCTSRLGTLPLKIPLVSLAALCTLLDLICSIMHTPPLALSVVISVLCCISVALTLISIFLSATTQSNAELLTPPALCCLLGLFTVLLPSDYVFLFTPEYTLSCLIILGITYYGFKEIITMERRNVYLTENMQAEIERQTKEMQSIIDERENVMRFISHDMRKPVTTMRKFLAVARERESDVEQVKTIDIIDQKAVQIEKSLNEISRYAKNTYVAEQSEVLSVKKIMQGIYTDLKPDCDANGIVLEAEYINAEIYAKPTILSSVLTNIVINAIEHASCTHIKMYAQKRGDTVCVMISDNGKGIDETVAQKMFEPYSGESDERNSGLGLYICKTHMRTMNGSIEYTADEGGATFTVILPKA